MSFSKVVALGGLMLLGACADPTEVVIFVDTTLAVPCIIDRVEITVQGDGDPVTTTADPTTGQVSLTVLREGSGADFDVTVTGFKGSRSIASSRATVAFTDAKRLSLPFILGPECMSAVCDATSSVSLFTRPPPSTRESCEGVSLQYTGAVTRLETPTDACDVAVDGFERLTSFSADEVEPTNEFIRNALVSGFEFKFYGERINKIWVSDDGYVSFATDKPRANASEGNIQSMTNPGLLKNGVAAFWDDLSSQNGQICLALLDQGGFDRLWITWKNMCFAESCTAADALTFSIGLEENSNRIFVQFIRMESPSNPQQARGEDAVMGIRGFDQTGCEASECSAQGVCADGTTPCGFTQGFARMPQPLEDWPSRWQFTPGG